MLGGAKRLLGGLLAVVVLALPAPAFAATLSAHASVQQVWVVGASPGERLALSNARGRTVAVQAAGPLGGVIFRGVAPGRGYRVRGVDGGSGSGPPTPTMTVLPDRSAPPSTRIYNQRIPASGYGYADPSGPESGIAPIANLLGFAVVDVNMRGTGCSGGGFSFFEALQNLDGYDVIETVARQPWVLGHRVGMIGISYGSAKPVLRIPPGYKVVAVLSITDSGAIAARCGGSVAATNSWLMPP